MVSKTTEYALLALVFLMSEGGRARSSATIAEATGAPSSYLSKVLQALCRAGILRSQRGPSGGFTLARDAEGISVLEVAEAVEGPDEPPPGVEGAVARGADAVRTYLASLAGEAQRTMGSTSLADLIVRK